MGSGLGFLHLKVRLLYIEKTEKNFKFGHFDLTLLGRKERQKILLCGCNQRPAEYFRLYFHFISRKNAFNKLKPRYYTHILNLNKAREKKGTFET